MNKVKELTEEIQKLENDYAEVLASNDDPNLLNYIWRRIKDLRSQLLLQSIGHAANDHHKWHQN